jgi:hypothetical protein
MHQISTRIRPDCNALKKLAPVRACTSRSQNVRCDICSIKQNITRPYDCGARGLKPFSRLIKHFAKSLNIVALLPYNHCYTKLLGLSSAAFNLNTNFAGHLAWMTGHSLIHFLNPCYSRTNTPAAPRVQWVPSSNTNVVMLTVRRPRRRHGSRQSLTPTIDQARSCITCICRSCILVRAYAICSMNPTCS